MISSIFECLIGIGEIKFDDVFGDDFGVHVVSCKAVENFGSSLSLLDRSMPSFNSVFFYAFRKVKYKNNEQR